MVGPGLRYIILRWNDMVNYGLRNLSSYQRDVIQRVMIADRDTDRIT